MRMEFFEHSAKKGYGVANPYIHPGECKSLVPGRCPLTQLRAVPVFLYKSRRFRTFLLQPVLLAPAGRREYHLIQGANAIRLTGECRLLILSPELQFVTTYVFECAGKFSTRIWPLPIENPWNEEWYKDKEWYKDWWKYREVPQQAILFDSSNTAASVYSMKVKSIYMRLALLQSDKLEESGVTQMEDYVNQSLMRVSRAAEISANLFQLCIEHAIAEDPSLLTQAGILLGEFANNLRSALNYTSRTYIEREVLKKTTAKRQKWMRNLDFPYASSKEEFDKKPICKATKDVQSPST